MSIMVIPCANGRRLAVFARGASIVRTWNLPGWVPCFRLG